ncbi:MAG: S26 family signal peptidase [Bacteroidales bacterium]|nr:S26 family signal peptidase [Bacteroidales bacterium]
MTLQTGEYFVLGDNRENSLDSRLYGPVTEDNNKGRVVSVYRRGNF